MFKFLCSDAFWRHQSHIRYFTCFFFYISTVNFDRFSNSSGILENSENWEPNCSQNWRTRTELFRTGSNHRTARNFEKCTLHKFYTLKLIAASDLCLNFFVLMLFEGTSARKHEIDKALPYLAMTNHLKLQKPCQYSSITALFQQMVCITGFPHHT